MKASNGIFTSHTEGDGRLFSPVSVCRQTYVCEQLLGADCLQTLATGDVRIIRYVHWTCLFNHFHITTNICALFTLLSCVFCITDVILYTSSDCDCDSNVNNKLWTNKLNWTYWLQAVACVAREWCNNELWLLATHVQKLCLATDKQNVFFASVVNFWELESNEKCIDVCQNILFITFADNFS